MRAEGRPGLRGPHASALLLLLIGGLACDPRLAFREYVIREPLPARFECPADAGGAAAPATSVPLLMTDVVDVRSADHRGRVGALPDQGAAVPFDPATPPLEVLRADLAARLSRHGIQVVSENEPAQPISRLEVVLRIVRVETDTAFTDNQGVIARVGFNLGLVRRADDEMLFFTRVDGRHTVQPLYVTSRSYQEALSGAYCRALDEAVGWMSTAPFRAALAGRRPSRDTRGPEPGE